MDFLRTQENKDTRGREMAFWEFDRLYEQLVAEVVARGMVDLLPDLAWDVAFRIRDLRYDSKDLQWVQRLGFEQHLLWQKVVDAAARHSACALHTNADFWDLEDADEIRREVAGWMGGVRSARATYGTVPVGSHGGTRVRRPGTSPERSNAERVRDAYEAP